MRLTEQNLQYYLGTIDSCCLGYSADLRIRKQCASGGIVSTILIELLESGFIDGALVSRIEIADGRIQGKSYIATSKNEILTSGGSIYFDIKPLSCAELKNFHGRLAVVALPCYLNKLQEVLDKDKELSAKIVLKIGLFCGHNSRKKLLLKFLEKERISLGDIEKFTFRNGSWRGKMRIEIKGSKQIEIPFSRFSVYQNLHFFSAKKCLYCSDHTAEKSDISCGDVWLRKMKKEPIKHSIFISRNKKCSDILNMLSDKNAIVAKTSSPKEIFMAQKRSLILHKGLYARSRIGRFFGYNIKCEQKDYTRWNDYVSALISMINIKWSDSESFQKLIFWIPRWLLYLYMLFFKFFHNF